MKGSVSLDKVILDTNNIISLFLKGNFGYLSDLKFKYNIELCTCPEQIAELEEVLSRHNNYFRKNLKLPLFEYISFFQSHSVSYDISLRYDGIDDMKDNFLIDLAYTSKAFYIISGDRLVLAKKHVKRIQIISMTQFNKMLRLL